MKKTYYIVAVATAALISCNNDIAIDEMNNGGQTDVFTATTEIGTRTTLGTGDDAGKVLWESSDVISINGVSYQSNSSGSVSTSFTKQGSVSATPVEGKYNAYYPASLYSDGLPSTYTYQAGKFNMPMYAESTTTTLAFKNICAVLAIKVASSDMATVRKIKVTSDQILWGSFTVSDNKAIPSATGDGYKTVILDCGSEGVATTAEGTTFYIPVPAQTYNYFNIYLSADGTTYKEAMGTKKQSGLGAIARNKIFNIDYQKNAVQLWDGSCFFSTMNLGATSETGQGTFVPRDNVVVSGYWSDNWKTPFGSEDMPFVGNSNLNITYQVVGGMQGFSINGKGAYSGVSLFLPYQKLDGELYTANYWMTNKKEGVYTYYLYLYHDGKYHDSSCSIGWGSAGDNSVQGLVRPILK